MDFFVELREPSACSAPDLDRFKRLVRKGEEVRLQTLDSLVSHALVLALVRVGAEEAAVGALKRPNPLYRKKVFAKAGVADPERFGHELGWVYVEEAFRGRGIAPAIVGALVAHLPQASAYATSLEVNLPMHRALELHGFARAGKPYASTRPNKMLLLFLRTSVDDVYSEAAVTPKEFT
ncbi:MAG: N-acetyltransferase [Ramlibacter sp.]|nr:N-acetyltransferase [Ramlibacter sp.]